jgi:hypothetical protein
MSEIFPAIVPRLAGTAQAGISLRRSAPEQPAPQPAKPELPPPGPRDPDLPSPERLRDLKFRTPLPAFRTRQSSLERFVKNSKPLPRNKKKHRRVKCVCAFRDPRIQIYFAASLVFGVSIPSAVASAIW